MLYRLVCKSKALKTVINIRLFQLSESPAYQSLYLGIEVYKISKYILQIVYNTEIDD